MPISEVYQMDNLEYMAGLPDKHFSLGICDPPYGINIEKMKRRIVYSESFEVVEGMTWIPTNALLGGENRVKGAAMEVLLVYCQFDQKYNCEPTARETMAATGLSAASVANGIKKLESTGFLERIEFPEADLRRKEKITDELRWEIFERDNFTCQICGVRRCLTIDHIHPEILGGTLDKENLRTLCRRCNARKGAR